MEYGDSVKFGHITDEAKFLRVVIKMVEHRHMENTLEREKIKKLFLSYFSEGEK